MADAVEFWFRLANLPYTLLVCFTLTYWLTVILGVVHIDSLDFDFDIEAEGILDTLQILNIGKVPFSIWLSIFITSCWGFSTIGNAVLDALLPVSDLLRLPLGALAIFPAGLAVTKLITNPMQKFFQQEKAATAKDMIGRSCLITSSEVTASFGTAEIKTDGAPLIINCRYEGDGQLEKGEEALIYDYEESRNLYHVTKAS